MSETKIILNGTTYRYMGFRANLSNLACRIFYKSEDGKSEIYQDNNEFIFRNKADGSVIMGGLVKQNIRE